MMNTRRAEPALIGVAVLVFAASTALTITWSSSMAAMPGMEMPGGWTMSMSWMRMPGQSWLGAAATFLGMWTVMMVAMMLPVLTPLLARLNRQTALLAAGYFSAWVSFGVAAYPVGIALAEAAMRVPALSRAAPLVGGLVLVIAGLLQFTPWKARLLACCRETPDCCDRRRAGDAWRLGLVHGRQCVTCCLGPTAALLVFGVMDLRAMAAVTLAICAERLAPAGERVAQVIGGVLIAAALFVIQPG